MDRWDMHHRCRSGLLLLKLVASRFDWGWRPLQFRLSESRVFLLGPLTSAASFCRKHPSAIVRLVIFLVENVETYRQRAPASVKSELSAVAPPFGTAMMPARRRCPACAHTRRTKLKQHQFPVFLSLLRLFAHRRSPELQRQGFPGGQFLGQARSPSSRSVTVHW
jgi:hypothetical protein